MNNNQNQKMRLMEQLMMIEDAKSTTETMRAMSAGAAQIKKMTKEANIKQASVSFISQIRV